MIQDMKNWMKEFQETMLKQWQASRTFAIVRPEGLDFLLSRETFWINILKPKLNKVLDSRIIKTKLN